MKKIAFLAVFVLLAASVLTAGVFSVINMKNGKVYKGKIKDLDEGVYRVEIDGKEYSIKEDEVLKLGWESDGKDSPGTGGRRKPIDKNLSERGVYFYLKPFAGYIMPGIADIASVFKDGIFSYGLEMGADFGNSMARNSLGLVFFTGKASGSLKYSDMLAVGSLKTTDINTVKYLVQVCEDFAFRFAEAAPFAVFLNLGAGMMINNDVLMSYPVVDNTWPVSGHYGRVAMTYNSLALFGLAGIEYYLNNNFIITAGAGYQAAVVYKYNDSTWREDAYYGYEAKPVEINGGGVIFTGGIKVRM